MKPAWCAYGTGLTARARGGPRRTSCSCQSDGLPPAPSSPYSPKPEGKSPHNARSRPRQPPSPTVPPHASPDPAVLQPSSSACHPDISPFRLLTRHLGLGLWHPANRETAAESFRPDSKALFSNLKGRELNPSHRSDQPDPPTAGVSSALPEPCWARCCW